MPIAVVLGIAVTEHKRRKAAGPFPTTLLKIWLATHEEGPAHVSGPLSLPFEVRAGYRNIALSDPQLAGSTGLSQPIPHAPTSPQAGLFAGVQGDAVSIVKSPFGASQKSGSSEKLPLVPF
jgi:hypothetical protein